MRTLDRKLLRDLRNARGQGLAIASVVGSGVAMFVLMLSTYQSLGLTKARYYERYRFADVFAAVKRAPLWLAADIERIPGVTRVDTRVVVDVPLSVADEAEPITGRLISLPDGRRPVLNDLVLRAGRFVEAYRDDEVMASEPFAAAHHLRVGDRLAAVINGRRRSLRIVGLALSPEYVYAIRPGELIADTTRFGILWMSRKALGTAFQMEGAFNDVSLTLARGASRPEVIRRLDRLLDPYGGLGAIPRNQQLSEFFLQGEIDSLRGMGEIVPVVFLGVAGFLLNIVLTRLVAVEREQIAVLKAVGYRNATIGWHYVKWALTVGMTGAVLGTMLGAVLGRALTALYTAFFNFPELEYRLPATVAAAGAALAALAAALGASGAARLVMTLPPAEAMRPAPPASFHVSWIERRGVRRFLSQPTRIILRNIQRHPSRTGLSVLGIAFGMALLIAGMFSIDSMDQVIDTQFNVAQRYDVMVTFVEPASAEAADELVRLPGVVRAEPFRSVAARLRAGPRSRSLVLAGLPAPAVLNRIVSDSREIVTVPPSGLVLSRTLAQRLAVGRGDSVQVEVLEGRRPVTTLHVADVVDDYTGTNAYLHVEALHRLMQEGDSLSGAYLQVDPRAMDDLYRRLKQTPRVAGVGLRKAALASFRTTLAETVNIMRTATIVVAAVIAFGVVYNTARIALSERARELATLRIIGFREGEVAFVLLGELALVTLSALPAGALIGYALSAATVAAFDTEVYRLPLVVSSRTYAVAALTTIVTAAASALIVGRRLARLDLIAVLKTRE